MIQVVTCQVKIPNNAGASERVSANFSLSHLDKSTGWSDDTNIALYWMSDTVEDMWLRIKNDKSMVPDTDWVEGTGNERRFYRGLLLHLHKKTKLYFATQDSVRKGRSGPILIYAEIDE